MFCVSLGTLQLSMISLMVTVAPSGPVLTASLTVAGSVARSFAVATSKLIEIRLSGGLSG
jgi:hypothetical protein